MRIVLLALVALLFSGVPASADMRIWVQSDGMPVLMPDGLISTGVRVSSEAAKYSEFVLQAFQHPDTNIVAQSKTEYRPHEFVADEHTYVKVALRYDSVYKTIAEVPSYEVLELSHNHNQYFGYLAVSAVLLGIAVLLGMGEFGALSFVSMFGALLLVAFTLLTSFYGVWLVLVANLAVVVATVYVEICALANEQKSIFYGLLAYGAAVLLFAASMYFSW